MDEPVAPRIYPGQMVDLATGLAALRDAWIELSLQLQDYQLDLETEQRADIELATLRLLGRLKRQS